MRLPRPRGWSLGVKLPLSITAIVAGVGLTIGATTEVQDWWRARGALEERALLLARAIAGQVQEPVLERDYWSIYKSLKRLTLRAPGGSRDPRIVTGMVLDTEGRVLAHLDPASQSLGLRLATPTSEERRLFDFAMSARTPSVLTGRGGAAEFVESVVQIRSNETFVGVVRLRLSTDEIYAQARNAALTVLALTLGMIVVGSLIGLVISRRAVRPLLALAEGMETVGRGETDGVVRVSVADRDEIGDLVQAFNRMAAELADKRALETEMAVNEKLVALGRIAAGVAHEVNNPLGGMINCLDTLKKHPDQPDLLDRYLPLLDKGLARIRDIVRSLLVELRIEDADEVRDPSCLDDLRDLVVAEIGDRDIELIWENGLGDHVRLSGPQVQQVVFNLLKNAVQMMPDGGTLTFRSFEDGDCLLLEVEDTGPGISAENRQRIFDPFFSTRSDGTGLGLWIVYRMVEGMRGRIEVNSAAGSGSLFQIFLPAGGPEGGAP